MKVLWLASWYPGKIEPYTGDFIQRHAQAVSQHQPVHVISVIRDEKGAVTRHHKIIRKSNDNLHETVGYYYSPQHFIKPLGKLISQIRYNGLMKKLVSDHMAENGQPDLVHVHVGMRAGIIARWLKKRYNIPYVITEHWTGFVSESDSRFEDLPGYIRRSWKKVVDDAAAISVVSNFLGEQLRRVFGAQLKPVPIPNVVNHKIFYPEKTLSSSLTRFIHVSSMNHQKNPEAILQAFSLVKERGGVFQLEIIGPIVPSLKKASTKLGLDKMVKFLEEMPQVELAQRMRSSHALVLYSRYETFGCVIIEANACGIPVIVSDIPTSRELVREGENGMLVKNEDPSALADAIQAFIDKKFNPSRELIVHDTMVKYSYETVGKQIAEWYLHVVN